MTTAYTSLLGLALPVTGELSGTWGDTVNNAITSLLDTAVAGTTTLSTDGDVTLTTTTGASNQARQAILLCSGARTAARNITAPAQSKIYTVINATTGGYAVVIRGAGPTTGITIPAGQTATVAWNGTDFVDASNYFGGNLKVNGNLSVTGTTTLTGALTANGNTTLGDASADTVTVNGTVTSNLIFTDNTYDIGASGATRPRTMYLGTSLLVNSGTVTYGPALGYAMGLRGTNTQTYLSLARANQTLDDQGMAIGISNSAANIIVRDNVPLQFFVNDTTSMVLRANGQVLGLNSSPTGWSGKAFETYTGNAVAALSATSINLTQNCYYDGTDWRRVNAAVAGLYQISDNTHSFYSAATGTANSTIPFSTATIQLNANNQTLLKGASAAPSTGSTTYSPTLSVTGGSGNAAYFTTSGAGNSNVAIANTAGSGTRYYLSFDAGSTRVGDFWSTDGATLQLSTVSQITFPSTQNASSNAYTLDDYREGSFTPNFRTTTGGNITASDVYAYYVKVGQMVYIKLGWFNSTTSASSWGGVLRFDLPFAAYYPANGRRDMTATIANIYVFSTGGQYAFFIVDTSTYADCYTQDYTNSWSGTGFTGNSSGSYLHISLTYRANA